MREILFRGKRVDNGEWVYGYPFVDTAPCSLKEKGHCKCPHDGSDAAIFAWVDAYHEYDDFWVAPATVGQYTGLTDKNGTKIFEDDVCYITDGQLDEEDGVFIVEWDNDLAGFILNGCYLVDFDNVYGHQIEVVGNIHDNPELLTEVAK